MDPRGAVLPQNCKHGLHLWPFLKPECHMSALVSCLTDITNYIGILYSNSGGLMKLDVFCFAPICKLHTLTVLASLQTLHRGLKGWVSHNSTLRTNNKTSIFKMSPLRLNSSIFTACFWLHLLSVSTWLNAITIRTMEIEGRLTPVAFVLRPLYLSAMDGGAVLIVPLMDTSARQQVLTLFFCMWISISYIFSVFADWTGELRRRCM